MLRAELRRSKHRGRVKIAVAIIDENRVAAGGARPRDKVIHEAGATCDPMLAPLLMLEMKRACTTLGIETEVKS